MASYGGGKVGDEFELGLGLGLTRRTWRCPVVALARLTWTERGGATGCNFNNYFSSAIARSLKYNETCNPYLITENCLPLNDAINTPLSFGSLMIANPRCAPPITGQARRRRLTGDWRGRLLRRPAGHHPCLGPHAGGHGAGEHIQGL